jgi:UTP--glucose-1-phosphate uridylyltransferase
MKHLNETYERFNSTVISVQYVQGKYDIISINESEIDNSIFLINNFIEIPKLEEAPSNNGISGRFILDLRFLFFRKTFSMALMSD